MLGFLITLPACFGIGFTFTLLLGKDVPSSAKVGGLFTGLVASFLLAVYGLTLI